MWSVAGERRGWRQSGEDIGWRADDPQRRWGWTDVSHTTDAAVAWNDEKIYDFTKQQTK